MMPPDDVDPSPPADHSPSDEDLALALAQGDDLALNSLMLRWQIPLRSFLYRYTQNEADALDLAQETFVRLFKHRSRYRTGQRYSTWMFQIALNLARDHARRNLRRPTTPLDATIEPTIAASPATDASRAEQVAQLRLALAELPPDLREAILLFEYQNLSHQEIAAVAKTTPKAIESRLYRARQLLREKLLRWL